MRARTRSAWRKAYAVGGAPVSPRYDRRVPEIWSRRRTIRWTRAPTASRSPASAARRTTAARSAPSPRRAASASPAPRSRPARWPPSVRQGRRVAGAREDAVDHVERSHAKETLYRRLRLPGVAGDASVARVRRAVQFSVPVQGRTRRPRSTRRSCACEVVRRHRLRSRRSSGNSNVPFQSDVDRQAALTPACRLEDREAQPGWELAQRGVDLAPNSSEA